MTITALPAREPPRNVALLLSASAAPAEGWMANRARPTETARQGPAGSSTAIRILKRFRAKPTGRVGAVLALWARIPHTSSRDPTANGIVAIKRVLIGYIPEPRRPETGRRWSVRYAA